MNRRRTYARSVFGAALVLLVGCRSLGSEAGAVTPTPTSLPATAPPATAPPATAPPVVAAAPGKPLACPAPPAPSTVPARAQPTPAAPSASGSVLFILDASSSMLDDDGSGHRKIDSAKAALSGLVETLPRGARVGLRIYGDRVPDTDKANGCTDTHLVVPVGPLDPAASRRLSARSAPAAASIGMPPTRASWPTR